ncbi:transcriptional regulator [Streptomyces aureoverticillatus]|nr:transcriptional regulator [Streptomyces aureoverticillatus]
MGAEGFAELLKELKGRSGLSYGVLAKRLHVSTSTLHRYVNGTAVPVEFAPVERFGRLCKASPAELVELHRRWIVADATRGKRAEGEPDVPVAEAELAPESSDPGPGAVPTLPQALDSAQAGEDPLAPRDDCPQQRGTEQEAHPEPEPASEAPLVTHRPAAPRRKRRQFVVVAAVGAVLALGGTALALQAASDGSSGGGGKAAAGRGPSAGDEVTEGGEGKPGRPSGKSSPGDEDGKRKDARGGSGEGGGEERAGGGKGRIGKGGSAPSGSAGDGTTGDAPAAGAVPLTVSTQPHFWYNPCGQPYLVAREPSRLSPPPNEQDAPGWVAANGAVPAGRQTVKLTVQGTGDDTVVLESLNIRVVGSGAPLKRNSYEMGYVGVGCGGDVPKHSFDVNLDASVPRLTPKSGETTFPYKVSESDPETFFVDADVKAHDVSWYLELEWSSGKRHGTVRIDASGKPFRTSGDRGNPVFGFSLDSKKWVGLERGANGAEEEAR